MTTTISRILGGSLLLVLCVLSGCSRSDHQRFEPDQFKLPKKLREVSGLTLTPQGQLLAIADEKATVYLLDLTGQKAPRFARFGDPVEKGDFEGLAVTDENLYATTSDGRLYQRQLHADDDNFQEVATGFGQWCEIEGLTAGPVPDELWFLCKTPRTAALQGKLTLLRWHLLQQRPLDRPWQVDLQAVGIAGELSPSGVVMTDGGRTLWIVAARQHVLLQFTRSGDLLGLYPLPARLHPQAEGIVYYQGSLYIADEGKGKRARISRYPLEQLSTLRTRH